MEKEKSCLSWSELGFSQTAPWPLLLKTYTATVLKDITFKINANKGNKQEKNSSALKVSPWPQQEKRPWLNLVVWLVAVIFIFSDIFTDGQCLDKTLSGILKMENKYRVGMGVLLLLNILAGENGTQAK